ncbi:AP endonuclease family 2 [Penicillium tannophilum]|nr:AP endonuclease family 2 [Penicillium tannophilum]
MLSNRLAIATCLSLARHPSHFLANKIRVAAKAGYTGIKIVCFDLFTEVAEQARVLRQEFIWTYAHWHSLRTSKETDRPSTIDNKNPLTGLRLPELFMRNLDRFHLFTKLGS